MQGKPNADERIDQACGLEGGDSSQSKEEKKTAPVVGDDEGDDDKEGYEEHDDGYVGAVVTQAVHAISEMLPV